jgi:DNA-binding NarL/FixJ family response regulator
VIGLQGRTQKNEGASSGCSKATHQTVHREHYRRYAQLKRQASAALLALYIRRTIQVEKRKQIKAKKAPPIRVLLGHSSREESQALSQILRQEPDLHVMGCITTPSELLLALQAGCCDVLLLDVALAEADALALVYYVVQQYPALRIIVTGLPDVPLLLLPYLEAGAAACSSHTATTADLIRQLRFVVRDRAMLSPLLATALIQRVAELTAKLARYTNPRTSTLIPDPLLTTREQQVLALLEQGLNNQEIADTLRLGVGTVKNYVHHILRKLKVANRFEAGQLKQLMRK